MEKIPRLFPRKERLVNQAEFDSVFSKAKKVSHRYMLALFKPNQLDFSRLGIIVSKKISKKAVVRNRIKRIVRESFRYNKIHLQGIDIIILMRQNSNEMSKKELRGVIDQLWEKLILCRQNA